MNPYRSSSEGMFLFWHSPSRRRKVMKKRNDFLKAVMKMGPLANPRLISYRPVEFAIMPNPIRRLYSKFNLSIGS